MNHHTTANAITAPSSLLEQIALKHFFVETLQTQNRDSLDFHDVSVWAIESALKAAFEAGVQAAQQAALKEKQRRLKEHQELKQEIHNSLDSIRNRSVHHAPRK